MAARLVIFAARFTCLLVCLPVGALYVGALHVGVSVGRAQTEDERLQGFLDRLGLVDLQALHLQQRVNNEPAGTSRTQLARRLADLYAQQMAESVADSERYSELSQRVQTLLRSVPEARTAALEVMLLQVDYQRAESLVNQWLSDTDADAARQEAQSILMRITPQLHAQYEQLWNLVDEQLAAMERIDEDNDAAERELLRRQSIAARATYFTGWSLYYRGILAGVSNGDDFQTARAMFRRLLDIHDEDKYAELDAESLALESPWRARSLVGLGMSEAALGNVGATLECFRLLRLEGAAREVRDQADYWCTQALLLAGHRQAALDFARPRLAALSSESTTGKIGFCVSLVRGGSREPAIRDSAIGRQLTSIGVQGLARLREFRVLRDLIGKYGIEVDNPQGFLLLWLQGQQRLDRAQTSNNAADFKLAADSLLAALSAADARENAAAASRCREQLAWCYYNLQRYSEAVVAYRQAAEGMKAAGDDGAVEAGWMSFVSASKLVDEQSGPVTAVHDAANWLNESFSEHDHAKRAMFLAGRLRMRSASPAERIRALENISPGDPSYSPARVELCAVYYEQWRDAAAEQKSAAAGALQTAIRESLAAERLAQLTPQDQLALRLMSADVELNSAPPDEQLVASQLSAARELIGRTGTSLQSVAEYHYRSMQLAKLTSKLADMSEHVDWFLDRGRGNRFESPALILAAKSADAAAAEPQWQRLGMRIYRRLTEIFCVEQQKLAANRNAQVALSRLAHYAYQLGERESAAAALDKLLAAFPNDRGYLRRAGLVRFELNQFQTALGHWRTILAGSRAGTEPWYEAKYYQIACLLEVDRAAAASVFQQLQLLDPDLGPPAWRDRFVALQEQLL